MNVLSVIITFNETCVRRVEHETVNICSDQLNYETTQASLDYAAFCVTTVVRLKVAQCYYYATVAYTFSEKQVRKNNVKVAEARKSEKRY